MLRYLLKVLGQHLGQVIADDFGKLTLRLALSEAGKCVVGFVLKEEIKQLIKNKLDEAS